MSEDGKKRERSEIEELQQEEPPAKQVKQEKELPIDATAEEEPSVKQPDSVTEPPSTVEGEAPLNENIEAGEKAGVSDAVDAVKAEPETNPNADSTNIDTLQIAVDRKPEASVEAEAPVPEFKSEPENQIVVNNNGPATNEAPIDNSTTAELPSGVPPLVVAQNNPNEIVQDSWELTHNVGKVIGRGGEMIRDLQARSGAKIDVNQNGNTKVVTIQGPRRKVEFAKQMIDMLVNRGMKEGDLPIGEAAQEILRVSAKSVGKIIGQGGELIRELQSRSQAKIQIDHSNTQSTNPDEKVVIVLGKPEAVAKAREMIMFLTSNPQVDSAQSLQLLIDEKKRTGNQWGTGPPYPGLPNLGTDMHPSQLQGMPGQYGAQSIPSSYPTQNYYGAPAAANPYAPQNPYPGAQPQGPPFGGVETDTIFISKQYTGRIIGQKGVTINDLQRRSGTNIQINQNPPPGQDCPVSVRGTRQGIDMVKLMVDEIIRSGPQHPYAGGSGTAGVPGVGGPPSHQYSGMYAQQQPYPSMAQPNQLYQQPQAPYHAQPYGPYGTQMPHAHYAQPLPQSYTVPASLPPPPAPATSPWKTATAPTGQIYYYNEVTQETSWEKPPGMP